MSQSKFSQEIIDKYLAKFQKAKYQIFTISNTSKKFNSFYFTPIRNHDEISVGGVVVSNTLDAIKFAEAVDGKIHFIAVDSEKKISPDNYQFEGDLGNIKGETKDRIFKSRFLTYKANDITVEALDMFICSKIRDISSTKISLIGVGNIGFKIALKLIERGCWVNLYRRNQAALECQVNAINLTKPRGTLANAKASKTLNEAIEDSDVVVALADQSNIISLNDIQVSKSSALLIDCGKNCFAHEINSERTIFRTDVTMSLIYYLKSLVMSENDLYPRFGKSKSNNNTYVCGVVGNKNDIVLNDIRNLKSIIGVCDGIGGLKPYA